MSDELWMEWDDDSDERVNEGHAITRFVCIFCEAHLGHDGHYMLGVGE